MTEQELAYELAKLINLSPEQKMDELIRMTFRTTICSESLSKDMQAMKVTLDGWPQKCLAQRLECEGKFSEIRSTGEPFFGVSKKKLGAVSLAVLLAILTAIGSAVASWLK